ncbi:MAG: alpha-ketoacid dehydrogenase subunit beta [Vicinamibacterales bacterium]|jgi:2-oxoisovalerate dehydrogenase E1 component beta subunit|nr:alpha-ketoacid dehydrogenase subunit beta [Acidobacteriota bacterium]MDP7471240.1 alpha-ketoacid dehydrogenase subunit beta [Vicinamibacterales bacterium]MDP7672622.1 alpha-ketoacid dehydrogenase subunit beta [Vicinamibacterales bacterium]HJO36994.1 alpha-ketoacid dehydrogenase subunit beta [Vicinamibacterales bacterium]|tara:strand:+ start:4245 stop:5219 length:975 start_codon:yes stop_codon:yes gene_type:complete
MAEMTYLEAIRQGLAEEMARDERVYAIGEDIGAYGGAFKVTEGLLERFGAERVIGTPISETAIIGAAIGSAYLGMRPVAELQFIDFVACCFNILTNFAAKSRYRWGAGVPMVVRGPCGGGVSGGPFHSANPEAHFLHTPGLKIVEPSTAYDAKGLIKAAIRDDDPVLFLEHKFLYRRVKDEVPDADYVVPIGQAVVRRPGDDVTVVTFGAMTYTALEAAEQLAQRDVEVEVIDLRTLSPLDHETVLQSVAKTNKVVVLHEAQRTGGIGAEIAAAITERGFEHLDAPPVRLASLDTPVPYNPGLEAAFRPGVEQIVAAVGQLVEY